MYQKTHQTAVPPHRLEPCHPILTCQTEEAHRTGWSRGLRGRQARTSAGAPLHATLPTRMKLGRTRWVLRTSGAGTFSGGATLCPSSAAAGTSALCWPTVCCHQSGPWISRCSRLPSPHSCERQPQLGGNGAPRLPPPGEGRGSGPVTLYYYVYYYVWCICMYVCMYVAILAQASLCT